jgi:hypothetical protein
LLIRDLEQSETVAEMIFKWERAIGLFRAIEQGQFGQGEPGPIDRKIHESFLHILIGFGQRLEILTATFDVSDLSNFRVNPDLAASVRELQDSLLMFYGPEVGEVPQSFIEALADFKAGRFVQMETALNEPPPGSKE